MRLLKYINELFDTKVDIKIKEQNLSANTYIFIVNDIEYEFNANNEKGAWQIEFGQDKGTGITGEGNAIQVFGAVAKCLNIFIKKYKPREFWFTAKEPSRKKLYHRMAKMLIKKYPYNFIKEKFYDEDAFIFEKK